MPFLSALRRQRPSWEFEASLVCMELQPRTATQATPCPQTRTNQGLGAVHPGKSRPTYGVMREVRRVQGHLGHASAGVLPSQGIVGGSSAIKLCSGRKGDWVSMESSREPAVGDSPGAPGLRGCSSEDEHTRRTTRSRLACTCLRIPT